MTPPGRPNKGGAGGGRSKRPSNRDYRPSEPIRPNGPKVLPNTPRGTTFRKPTLIPASTSLWQYPSQHYDAGDGRTQGDPNYIGATPGWVIWQVLQRYTKPGDTVVDPMCGSGTTLDVCHDLRRKGLGFDLVPRREEIDQADARELPLKDGSAALAFVDPPYSTHIDYSDHPDCIGRLDAARNDAYFEAMFGVLKELTRVVRAGGVIAVYVSDSVSDKGGFVPIGFNLWSMLTGDLRCEPIDIVSVVRHNAKLRSTKRNERAREGGPLERGFNWLLLVRTPGGAKAGRPRARGRSAR